MASLRDRMHAPSMQGKVEATRELGRILALPWRTDSGISPEDLTAHLGGPPDKPLWKSQSEALIQFFMHKAAVLGYDVGTGKTLISYLAPRIFEAKRPVLLVPGGLVEKTEREFAELAKSWGPVDHTIVSYSILSTRLYGDYRCRSCKAEFELVPQTKRCKACKETGTKAQPILEPISDRVLNELERLNPDLLIADEAHALRNPNSACGRRFRDWRKQNPEVPHARMSGTLSNRKLMEIYPHLLYTLGPERMPLPRRALETATWGRAVDEKVDTRAHPGALSLLLEDNTKRELEDFRGAVGKRIFESPGVLSASAGDKCGAAIHIKILQPTLPTNVQAILSKMIKEKVDLNGDELTPAAIWQNRQMLSLGFQNKWQNPPPEDWMTARRAWHRMVREWIELDMPQLDTEFNIAKAAHQKKIPSGRYERWQKIKNTFKPIRVPEWYSTEMLEYIIKRAQNTDVWIWVSFKAVGKKLAELTGWPYYCEKGLDAKRRFIDDHRNIRGPAIVSVKANRTGRNLQFYSRNIVTTPDPNGEVWEQKIGRTHRAGQEAYTVSFEVVAPGALITDFNQAVADAKYQFELKGERRKLSIADIVR